MRKIADYLDMYVMAATGPGRRQVYVNNQFDPCCAFGVHPTQWGSASPRLSRPSTKSVQQPSRCKPKRPQRPSSKPYRHTHKDHKISSNVQQNVILPALGLSE